LLQWGSSGSGNGQFNAAYIVTVIRLLERIRTDANNSGYRFFDTNGNYLYQWGSFGTGNGNQRYFRHRRHTSGHVYVAEYNGNRVQKFDLIGTYLSIWKRRAGSGTSMAPRRRGGLPCNVTLRIPE